MPLPSMNMPVMFLSVFATWSADIIIEAMAPSTGEA